MKNLCSAALALTFSIGASTGATITWNAADTSSAWNVEANWSSVTLPSSEDDVVFDSTPDSALLYIQGGDATIRSLSFMENVNSPISIYPIGEGGTSLSVSGNMSFSPTGGALTLYNTLHVTGDSIWNGDFNLYSNVNIGTNTVTIAGNSAFFDAAETGAALSFTINSASEYGRFLVDGVTTTATMRINILGSYAGAKDDVFYLTNSDFSGAALGDLPTLSLGLSWDTSLFEANGVLSVVPEEKTWALVALSLTAMVVFRRRRDGQARRP